MRKFYTNRINLGFFSRLSYLGILGFCLLLISILLLLVSSGISNDEKQLGFSDWISWLFGTILFPEEKPSKQRELKNDTELSFDWGSKKSSSDSFVHVKTAEQLKSVSVEAAHGFWDDSSDTWKWEDISFFASVPKKPLARRRITSPFVYDFAAIVEQAVNKQCSERIIDSHLYNPLSSYQKNRPIEILVQRDIYRKAIRLLKVDVRTRLREHKEFIATNFAGSLSRREYRNLMLKVCKKLAKDVEEEMFTYHLKTLVKYYNKR